MSGNPPQGEPIFFSATDYREIIKDVSKEEGAEDYSKKLAHKENQDKFEDHGRVMSYKRHIHKIVVCGMYLLGFIFLCTLCIRAWHLVSPDNTKWQWLSGNQLHSLDAVLLSSIILSLAKGYFNYYKLFQSKNSRGD